MIILNSFSNLLIYVIIRKAKASDKNIILDFCKTTFSWGDYISDVWKYWISEGNLLVLTDNKTPVAICHSTFFDKQVWIEGIRVNEKFRKKGFAKNLVLKSEFFAKNKNCNLSKMLIESNNTKSLNLAKNLKYKRESIWNFYSLNPISSDKNTKVIIAENDKKILKFLLTNLSSYVKSWRWIPFSKTTINSLINQKRILYTKLNNKIDSLVIFTESEHFEKTLILTMIPGSKNGILQILTYIQNYAVKNNFKRIQILTKSNLLKKILNLEKKLSFYLMKKDL